MRAETACVSAPVGISNGQKPTDSYPTTQPITRLFHPDPAILTDLVEALYRLLTECPESQAPGVLNPSESACFRSPPE